jgi:hypothetical protein
MKLEHQWLVGPKHSKRVSITFILFKPTHALFLKHINIHI